MLRQSLWAPCTHSSSMPASYTVLCGLGHLHCDILIFMTRALFLLKQDAIRCYQAALEETRMHGVNVFCELEGEVWSNFGHEPYNHACVNTCLYFAMRNACRESPLDQWFLRSNFELLVHYKYPTKFSFSAVQCCCCPAGDGRISSIH